MPTRGWGSTYKLSRLGGSEGVPGPDSIAHVFIFIGSITLGPLYKLTLSPKVTLPLRVSLYDLV